MRSVTRQRQCSSGNFLGSNARRWTNPEADACALALTTVFPSCNTSWYCVGFLNLDSVHASQPSGSAFPGGLSEKWLTCGRVITTGWVAHPPNNAATSAATIPLVVSITPFVRSVLPNVSSSSQAWLLSFLKQG